MNIFLTGGTGFVGNAIAAMLLDAGHGVRALVRKGSESKLKVAAKCEIVSGDIDNSDALVAGIKGTDAVIHLVGIIEEIPKKGVTFEKVHVEGARNVAQAAERAGVRRFLHMSALGARAGGITKYFRTKWVAEEYLRTLSLDLTIFRPSVIIGPEGEFTTVLKKLCSAPITPVIGDGKYKLQPVAQQDIAACFVRALTEPKAIGKAYCVGGPEQLSFNEMLEIFGAAMGKKARLLHMPKAPIMLMTKLLEGLPAWPITGEQLAMLEEDQSCDIGPIRSDLQVVPMPFRDACLLALKTG